MKRKFRVPGQTFSDSIGSLISFIESNPMVRVSELATKFLGIAAAQPRPAEAPAAPAAGEADSAVKPTAGPEPVKAEMSLSLDERAKISRMQGDLMWLVREGYVTEFIDGRLFAPPPMVEARKREVEASEHDPENFPEAPTASEPAKPVLADSTAPAQEPALPDAAMAEAGAAEPEAPVQPANDAPAPTAEPPVT